MPRFAANLSMLFGEVEFLDRFEAASRGGFQAVEVQFPYDWPAPAIADRLRRHGLELVLLNLPAGDWAGGERGIACHPGREAEFREGLGRAAEYAAALGARQVNCLAGIAPAGVSPEVARRTFVANLRQAATRLGETGLRLNVEAVNTRDVPGFWLHGTAQAAGVLDEVGAPNLFLQLDAYHARAMGEDLGAALERFLPRIGHVQIADHPGRHEPGTGETDFASFLGALDRLGYGGWVGCEYRPLGRTEEGLSWLGPWRKDPAGSGGR
ncbi:MAG TPA: hydroxypyruvate isomerase [Anaeromyxobacteraceae bacterium]|nr:hydroxypyruvate isomerase [Anaeromyxobacteraceae bacterium]